MFSQYDKSKGVDSTMEDLHKTFARRPKKQALSAIIEKIVIDKQQRDRERVFGHYDVEDKVQEPPSSEDTKMTSIRGEQYRSAATGGAGERGFPEYDLEQKYVPHAVNDTVKDVNPLWTKEAQLSHTLQQMAASGDHHHDCTSNNITSTTSSGSGFIVSSTSVKGAVAPSQQTMSVRNPTRTTAAAFPVLQESLLTNPAKPIPWKAEVTAAMPSTSVTATADEEDDGEEDDEPEDKEEPGADAERLKAFNMFVRLFVDENLDRSVPMSKQPRERVQAIMDSCARQFPEFGERARKRLRTYLKACRRSKRFRDGSSSKETETPNTSANARGSRAAPPHLTSPQAELILATACQNESENVKRMMMGLEPLAQPVMHLNIRVGSDILQQPVLPPAASATPMVSSDLSHSVRPAPPFASAASMTPSELGHPIRPAPPFSHYQTGVPPTPLIPTSGAHAQTPSMGALYQANMAQLFQQMLANGAGPAASAPVPGELYVRRPPAAQLSSAELAAVRQLIRGYRESANFLRRSADELELLLTRSER